MVRGSASGSHSPDLYANYQLLRLPLSVMTLSDYTVSIEVIISKKLPTVQIHRAVGARCVDDLLGNAFRAARRN